MFYNLLLILTSPLSIFTVKLKYQKFERILGGIDANEGQFPWAAELILHGAGKVHQCTGSLMNRDHVLTAGHCLNNVEYVTVVLGHTVSAVSTRANDGIVYPRVLTWTRHRCFNGPQEQFQYDLTLIKLPEPVNYSETIYPIALPENDGAHAHEGAEAVALGWGNTGPNGAEKSERLLHATMSIVGKKQCADSHREKADTGDLSVSAGYALNIHPGNYFVCVRGARRAICEGDSGGSLAVNEDNAWVIVGVASFTSEGGCKRWRKPQSYVRVSKHLKWIESVMRDGTEPRDECVHISQIALVDGGCLVRATYVSLLCLVSKFCCV